MTVKEYIDAIVRISDERAEANELIKKKLDELLADIEEQHDLLIKDEKIRKAIRAWAEACDIPNDVQLDVFEYL